MTDRRHPGEQLTITVHTYHTDKRHKRIADHVIRTLRLDGHEVVEIRMSDTSICVDLLDRATNRVTRQRWAT